MGDAEAETVAYAKATLGLLTATRASVILDRSYLSMWAYADDPPYMQPLIAALTCVDDAYLVVLTTEMRVLRERYRRTPDQFFTESQVLDANARFERILDVVPPAARALRLDTGRTNVTDCCRAIDQLLSRSTDTPRETTDEDFEIALIPVGAIPVEVAHPRLRDERS